MSYLDQCKSCKFHKHSGWGWDYCLFEKPRVDPLMKNFSCNCKDFKPKPPGFWRRLWIWYWKG